MTTMNDLFAYYLQRMGSRIVAIALIIMPIILLVAIISYNASDPSFNTTTPLTTRNLLGSFGAHLSDLLLQIIGCTSLLLVPVPMTWGTLMITDRPINKGWLRLSALIASLPLLSGFLAVFSPPGAWPMDAGLGGYVGDLLKSILAPMITKPLFAIICLALFILSYGAAFGFSLQQWQYFALVAFYKLQIIYEHTSTFVKTFFEHDAPSHYRASTADEEIPYEEEEEVEEAEEEAPRKSRSRKKSAAPIIEERAKPEVSKRRMKQANLRLGNDVVGFELPPISLLGSAPKRKKDSSISESALSQNAKLLNSVLKDFGVQGEIVKIHPGPVVTLYELEPAAGVKTSRVIGLADDIARSMSAISARISVIPGKNAIGIELPNATRETVYFRELLESASFKDSEAKLPMALGKNIGGEPITVDLAKMPHLLVAGTTGSGKSVSVNAMILSLLYKLTPDQCKFIMIDPKMLELSVYQGIPHLLAPVVTEPGKAVVALKWTVKEMENRYRLMSNFGVRNIAGYNEKINEAIDNGEQLSRKVQTGYDPDSGKPIIEEIPLEMNPLPLIVVVVDEMADLMMVAGKDIESSIQRLAQMARAAGIHIIMATQRPSVDVITGVIKANFPTRISFQVTSKIDSRTILGEQGAEQLLGMGDMLFMAGGGKIGRVHGPFVTDAEVDAVVSFLKEQGEPSYLEDITKEEDEEESGMEGESEADDLYTQAVNIVMSEKKASTSYIQRRLKIGYNRAADLIERMEQEGVVSAANHAGKREVYGR